MVIKKGLRLVVVEPVGNVDSCNGCVFDDKSLDFGCPVVDNGTSQVLICSTLSENRHWIDAGER